MYYLWSLWTVLDNGTVGKNNLNADKRKSHEDMNNRRPVRLITQTQGIFILITHKTSLEKTLPDYLDILRSLADVHGPLHSIFKYHLHDTLTKTIKEVRSAGVEQENELGFDYLFAHVTLFVT